MKYILIIALALVGFAGKAQAHVLLDEFDNPIIHSHPNGDPMLVVNAWGLNGYQTPIIAVGAVIADEGGITTTCPSWYPKFGCFDLTRTEYYRNQMRETARQISQLGVANQFGQMSYWLNQVK